MTGKKSPLPVEELEAIAGGENVEDSGTLSAPPCPRCGSLSVKLVDGPERPSWYCYDCGYQWVYTP